MSKRYILNNAVEFSPEEYQLLACNTQNPAIKLNMPVSRCLELLIIRRYSLVPHKEFYTFVWGDDGVSVSTNSLYQNIALLRKALKTVKEDGEKMIQTVPKQGFSLHTDVTVEEVEEENRKATPFDLADINTEVVVGESSSEEIMPSLISSTGGRRRYSRINRKCILFSAGVVILLGLLVFQLFQWGSPLSTDYLSKYMKIGTISECQVFANHTDADKTQLKKMLDDNQVDCIKMPYAYITSFKYSKHRSLLSCDRAIDASPPPKCFAFNNIEEAK